MAFIPIHAKADIKTGEGAKKGKITPLQASILNAWCLANKTGILDCLDKCVAKEENITNIVNNEAVITFGSGFLVICGRLIECENGTKVSVRTPATDSISGRIIARFSLSSSGENEFQVLTKTGTLIQQDLNSKEYMKTGTYEFELYTYTATPTTLKLERTFDYVPDLGGKLSQFEQSLTAEGKPLGGYDTSKGTIEERLTELGFKKATITNLNTDYIKSIDAFQQGSVVAVIVKLKNTFTENHPTNPDKTYTVGKISGIDLSEISSDGVLICQKCKTWMSDSYTYYLNNYILYNTGKLQMISTSGAYVENKTVGGIIVAKNPTENITIYI